MKLRFHCFHLLPVLAAGLMISPLCAQSPDRPAGPPPGDAPREAPQPERIKAAARQIVELHKAGKHEEAQAITQRLRQAAKDNPEAAKQIFDAMKELRQQQPGAKTPDQPRPEVKRPNAPDQPRPEVKRPNAPDQPQPQMRRPNAPDQPQPQMRRPNAPGQPQCPLMQPNAPARPQCPLMQPNAAQMPPRPMAWSPNSSGVPQGPMAWPKTFQAPRPPLMRPNAADQPQRPMMRHRVMAGRDAMKMRGMAPEGRPSPMAGPQAKSPQPPVVRPRVEAAKQRSAGAAKAGEIAKIRHLKQAAEHLAAAGLSDHAAMARQMISRMEAAVKSAPKPAPTGKPQKAEKQAPKAPHEKAKPKTERPDANAAMMGELKKLVKQMAELNGRVRKLEAQDDKK